MRSSRTVVAVVVAVSMVMGVVAQFPAASVYCGNGDLNAYNTDYGGVVMVNGNLQMSNSATGNQLPDVPNGEPLANV